jgi:hydroxymethylbilane synthase
VGSTLDGLRTGAIVATGSVRRRAQLAALRSDLGFAELRGNMQTRLDKAAGFDAIVVAAAALDRLGLDDRIAERLPVTKMLPQIAQGALAVECRDGDDATLAVLATIDAVDVHRAIDAERAFLAELGGGCDQPVGALAGTTAGGAVEIEGLIASLDGRIVIRESGSHADAATAGRELAAAMSYAAGVT